MATADTKLSYENTDRMYEALAAAADGNYSAHVDMLSDSGEMGEREPQPWSKATGWKSGKLLEERISWVHLDPTRGIGEQR